MSLTPTDCHPDFQEERLAALAQFFAETRSDVAGLHDVCAGDDGWSLGCRSFARCRNLLVQKASSAEWPWLRIVNPGKRFIFSIGAVPVRFFRGSINRPPERTLAYSALELAQRALAFDDIETPYAQLHWRFAIETGPLGEPTAVIFAGLAREDGAVICHWVLPFAVDDNALPDEPRIDDIVALPAPTVGITTSRTTTAHGQR
jgi:hypothetical protein